MASSERRLNVFTFSTSEVAQLTAWVEHKYNGHDITVIRNALTTHDSLYTTSDTLVLLPNAQGKSGFPLTMFYLGGDFRNDAAPNTSPQPASTYILMGNRSVGACMKTSGEMSL